MEVLVSDGGISVRVGVAVGTSDCGVISGSIVLVGNDSKVIEMDVPVSSIAVGEPSDIKGVEVSLITGGTEVWVNNS